MAIIMLGFMLGMYKNRRANMVIVATSLVLFGLGTWLARSQTTVQETSYMSAMIPHYSIAILTSELSEIEDVRVCELAVEVIEAQRREIAEMEWLIEDIDQNGTAASAARAAQRPSPSSKDPAPGLPLTSVGALTLWALSQYNTPLGY